jgi:hypothetical protein
MPICLAHELSLYDVLALWFGTPKGLGAIFAAITVIALFAQAFENH